MLTAKIPSYIPQHAIGLAPPVPVPMSDPFSLYDVAFNGTGYVYSNTHENPAIRETAPFEKQRVDQEKTPGEQTLTGWWLRSQNSFQGGAGQLQLEPATPTPYDQERFTLSKNVNVWSPGVVSRLPDAVVVSTANASNLVACVANGVDAVAFITGGEAQVITSITTTPTDGSFPTHGGAVLDLASDGKYVYCATTTGVYQMDPSNLALNTLLATYPVAATTATVGWVKARLMLGVNGAVYELDVSSPGVTLDDTQLRYQHPTPGFTWRAFSVSPQAILAAGDAGGQSAITQFDVVSQASAPVLTVAGEIATLPTGERILDIQNIGGTYLGIGTSKGFRVGKYDSYYSRLSYGPLTLTADLPVIPCVQVASRDFQFFAAGLAFDEGGLIRVDSSQPVDQAGRCAWAPDLVAPIATTTAATGVVSLPNSQRLVMCIPGRGVMLEGVGPGSVREAWLQTSRIRFGTVEPKLFKSGSVRGDLLSGEIVVSSTTPAGTTALTEIGFTDDQISSFRMPEGNSEWVSLTFRLIGPTSKLTGYTVRALPGTRKQRIFQFVLAITSSETMKTGQRVREALSARERLSALEELDAAGDEVLLQEFTPAGVISTRVVIEQISFKQINRPTARGDINGDATVTVRTVES